MLRGSWSLNHLRTGWCVFLLAVFIECERFSPPGSAAKDQTQDTSEGRTDRQEGHVCRSDGLRQHSAGETWVHLDFDYISVELHSWFIINVTTVNIQRQLFKWTHVVGNDLNVSVMWCQRSAHLHTESNQSTAAEHVWREQRRVLNSVVFSAGVSLRTELSVSWYVRVLFKPAVF